MNRPLRMAATLALLSQCAQPSEPNVVDQDAAVEADAQTTGKTPTLSDQRCDDGPSAAFVEDTLRNQHGFISPSHPPATTHMGSRDVDVLSSYPTALKQRALYLYITYDNLAAELAVSTEPSQTARLAGLEQRVFAVADLIRQNRLLLNAQLGNRDRADTQLVEHGRNLIPGYAYMMLIREGDIRKFGARIARGYDLGLLGESFSLNRESRPAEPDTFLFRAATYSLVAWRLMNDDRVGAEQVMRYSLKSYHAPAALAQFERVTGSPVSETIHRGLRPLSDLVTRASNLRLAGCSAILHEYFDLLNLQLRVEELLGHNGGADRTREVMLKIGGDVGPNALDATSRAIYLKLWHESKVTDGATRSRRSVDALLRLQSGQLKPPIASLRG